MPVAAPTSPSLAGTIFAARPIVPLELCMVMLDLNEDKIMALVEKGTLEWAFDIGKGGRTRQIRIFGGSLLAVMTPGTDAKWTERKVLEASVPHGEVLGADLARAWTCSRSHISNLVTAGFLGTVKSPDATSGPSSSPTIARPSILKFLASRRCL